MTERKVAIVSGTANGIGAATTERLAREGYAVIGLDVKVPEKASAGEYDSRICDVADESAVTRIIADVVQKHGRIDALVNVAGVVLVKPLMDTKWEEYRRIVDVNLGGTFLLLKHVLPVMARQRRGTVVNLGSVSGHVGQIDHALYGATKAAVIAICRGLAWEMAQYNVRINSISPGSVDTPMLRGDIEIESKATGKPYAEVKTLREGEQAFGRWADPAEIANAIYFLISNEASFITGTDILVDCGWTAR
jgi:NAD(P)-dependent dehydrogenase (short-subunit alcohol dehydrogenase family)